VLVGVVQLWTQDEPVETFGVVFALVSFWAKPICDKRKSLRSRNHEFGELVVGQGCFFAG
jgi:hypothetical protein